MSDLSLLPIPAPRSRGHRGTEAQGRTVPRARENARRPQGQQNQNRAREPHSLQTSSMREPQQPHRLSAPGQDTVHAYEFPVDEPSGAQQRSKFKNANHLLGFTLAPRAGSGGLSAPIPRRLRRAPVFSKERFLQANYRFRVQSTASYDVQLADPDQMIEWTLIDRVHYKTPHAINCPICLDTPVAAKITKCGHIYCWPCILRYLSYSDTPSGEKRHWRRCPLCFDAVTPGDLKSVDVQSVRPFATGDPISLVLLQRARGSTVPFRRENGAAILAGACPSASDADAGFARFTLSEDAAAAYGREALELEEARVAAENLADGSAPFVALALAHLRAREEESRRRAAPATTEELARAGSGPQAESAGARPSSSSSASRPDTVQRPASAPPPRGGARAGRHRRSPFYDEDELEEALEEEEEEDAFEDPWGSDAAPSSPAAPSSAASLEGGPPSLGLPESPAAEAAGRAAREKRGGATDPGMYYFYQAADEQYIFLHPLDVKILLHEFGSYAAFPPAVEGVILELEKVTMTEEFRRRHKYLAHLPLAADFTMCEIDLSRVVSPETLRAFAAELKQRWRQRMERERAEKRRSEAAVAKLQAERERLAASMTTRRDEEHPPLAPSPPLAPDAAEAAAAPTDPARVWGARSGRDVVEGGYCTFYSRSGAVPTSAPASSWPAAGGPAAVAAPSPAGPSFSAVLRNQASAAPPEAPAAAQPDASGKKKNKKGVTLLSTAGARKM